MKKKEISHNKPVFLKITVNPISDNRDPPVGTLDPKLMSPTGGRS